MKNPYGLPPAPRTLAPGELRYRVIGGGSVKRPFQVLDYLGGWVCASFSSEQAAQKRAAEQNGRT